MQKPLPPYPVTIIRRCLNHSKVLEATLRAYDDLHKRYIVKLDCGPELAVPVNKVHYNPSPRETYLLEC